MREKNESNFAWFYLESVVYVIWRLEGESLPLSMTFEKDYSFTSRAYIKKAAVTWMHSLLGRKGEWELRAGRRGLGSLAQGNMYRNLGRSLSMTSREADRLAIEPSTALQKQILSVRCIRTMKSRDASAQCSRGDHQKELTVAQQKE